MISYVVQANWRPGEGVVNPNQSRPAAHLQTVKVSSELAQDRRAWGTSVSDVVNWIGDTGPTRPVTVVKAF